MAGYSARQSSFTTGDTITAAHSNDEFNQVLAAFHATTGHTHDGTAGEGGPITTLRDADANNKVLVDSTNNHLEFYVEVSSSAVQQLRIQDGAIVPITDSDIDLGTSSLEFKDLYIDGTAYVDAINFNGTAISATAAELNLIDGGATVGTTAIADGDGIIHNDDGTMRVTSATTFKTYFQTGVTAAAMAADDLSAGDAAVTLSTSSGNITIDATANDSDIIFKGTDNSSDITMLTLDGSEAGKATFNSDVVVGGDLTVTGDDITMGTNTSGNILVADGTNFNSIAATSLSEISTVASDDVLLAVDTSGGGLKKIARSTLVSGLASSSAISNVVEDTTPQLGGDLDMNGQDIVTTSNADLELAPNGTGHVTIKGNTNPGTIQFNCENNSHGQQLKAQAHSVGSSAVHTLPNVTGELMPGKIEGTNFTDSLLVGHATTGTLSSADDNTGVGIGALDALTSGDSNTALGQDAATALTTGSHNVFIGSTAGAGATDMQGCIGIGSSALGSADPGNNNIAIGESAGLNITGVRNLCIGENAGDNITSGSGNIIIGSAVDPSSATDNRQLIIAGNDGSTTTTWISGDNNGVVTLADDLVIKDGGTIGVSSDADAITIASNGAVTFSQTPVFPDGSIAVADLDIDGATDIGADLVDADLFIVDDGAGGTNRKVAASRVKTYIGGGTSWQAVKTGNFTASAGQGVFVNTTSAAITITLPAGTIGDEVSIVDYAGTFDSNACTIAANGSEKIFGSTDDLTVSTERAAFTLVFTDSTQGWLFKND